MLRRLALCAAFALVGAGRARAQNGEPFYYSDDASMTAGAVTASSQDGGSVWYNPAGLGAIHRSQVDLSGSTYGLRLRSIDGLINTTLPGDAARIDVSSADLVTAPNALSFVRAVSRRVTLALGVFITGRDVRSISRTVEQAAVAPDGTTSDYRQRVDGTLDSSTYHAGPAIGIEITPRLRLGLAAFVSYSTQSTFFQWLLDDTARSSTKASEGFVVAQTRNVLRTLGGMVTLGLQGEVARGWTLGLLVRSPEVLFASWLDGAEVVGTGSTETGTAGNSKFTIVPLSGDSRVEQVAPARLVLGVSRAFGPSWVGLDVELLAPLRNDNRGIDQQFSVNARLGGRWQVSPRVALGAGVFTDLANHALSEVFTAERVDYFGATLGLQLRTPVALVRDPRPDALVLVTTLSVRYALGIGEVRGVNLDADTGAETPRTVSVVYQEIVPYLGSSLLF